MSLQVYDLIGWIVKATTQVDIVYTLWMTSRTVCYAFSAIFHHVILSFQPAAGTTCVEVV